MLNIFNGVQKFLWHLCRKLLKMVTGAFGAKLYEFEILTKFGYRVGNEGQGRNGKERNLSCTPPLRTPRSFVHHADACQVRPP